MKIRIFLSIALLAFTSCNSYTPVNGDLIFQSSLSNQSKAIELATNSPYSHMGIVYLKDGKGMYLKLPEQ